MSVAKIVTKTDSQTLQAKRAKRYRDKQRAEREAVAFMKKDEMLLTEECHQPSIELFDEMFGTLSREQQINNNPNAPQGSYGGPEGMRSHL